MIVFQRPADSKSHAKECLLSNGMGWPAPLHEAANEVWATVGETTINTSDYLTYMQTTIPSLAFGSGSLRSANGDI
jgi:hypothetical protein